MNVKFGLRNNPREITVSVDLGIEELNLQLHEAMENSHLLQFSDEKGTTYLIQASQIAYAEISAQKPSRVGFSL